MYAKRLVLSLLAAAVLAGGTGVAYARELVMGLIPAENNEEMIAKFEPMRAYLEKKLGRKVKVYTATNDPF